MPHFLQYNRLEAVSKHQAFFYLSAGASAWKNFYDFCVENSLSSLLISP